MFNTAAGTDEIQEVIFIERLAAITSNHTQNNLRGGIMQPGGVTKLLCKVVCRHASHVLRCSSASLKMLVWFKACWITPQAHQWLDFAAISVLVQRDLAILESLVAVFNKVKLLSESLKMTPWGQYHTETPIDTPLN